MANFDNRKYPWPTDENETAVPETGGNTRLLFAEQDNYRTRKGKDDVKIESTWYVIAISTRGESGYRAVRAQAADVIDPQEYEWYYDTQLGFREYKNGEWIDFAVPSDDFIGLHSGDSAQIWGEGIYENDDEAIKLFDDFTYDPNTYDCYETSLGRVFYNKRRGAVCTVRGDYELVSKTGNRAVNDIFYVVPRVVSADIAETTDNIPIEFLKGSLSANKAQAGALTFGNGFSIAASEEGLQLFIRTLCGSRENDIDIQTHRVHRKRGTITALAMEASDEFYLGEHTTIESADIAAGGIRKPGNFYWENRNYLFYYLHVSNVGRWRSNNVFESFGYGGKTYHFASSKKSSRASWETLDDFIDALDYGVYASDFITVYNGGYIIHVTEDNTVYKVIEYTPGAIIKPTESPRRDMLPNYVTHIRDADTSLPTSDKEFIIGMSNSTVVQLELVPDNIDIEKLLEVQIDGYDYLGNKIRETVWCTESDNCTVLKTDLYFAEPPIGRKTTYKINRAGGKNSVLTIKSQDKYTEITFSQQDDLLPGWTLEARKGLIPITYVGVFPNTLSIVLSRNTALQLDMSIVAYNSYPYRDITGKKKDKETGDPSKGIDIIDNVGKGYHDFVDASETLFTGWQAYLETMDPTNVIPFRIPLTNATFTIDHKIEQAQLIVGDRRPGPTYKSGLRDVMLQGSMLFTRERDWNRFFRNNISFENPIIVLKNAASGRFPYQLHIELGLGQLMSSTDPVVSDVGLITQEFSMKFRETFSGESDDFMFKMITDKWQFSENDNTLGGLRVDGIYR